jgi:hypothetical protein
VTISLWDSRADLRAVETRAAQLRSDTAQAIGVAAPAVDIYEVEIAVPASPAGPPEDP